MSFRFISAAILLSLLATTTMAAQPPRFNYQGKLTDSGGLPLNGLHSLTFWIYEGGTAGGADSGTQKYKETASVQVDEGIASHAVGSGTPVGGALSNDVFRSSAELFLQVAVGAESNVILPRQRLESVPFSIASADGDARIPLSGPLPITIAQSGSYYLTQSLSQASTTEHGIIINAENVTVDLNGYTLQGPGSGTSKGVLSNSFHAVIRNGFIVSWGSDGILIGGDGADISALPTRIERIHIRGTQGRGIYSGFCAQISDCTVSSVNGVGINAGNRSLIRGCIVSETGPGTAIVAGHSSIVEGCSATECQAGIAVGGGSTVNNCVAFSNFGNGITGDVASRVTNCTAGGGENGIICGENSMVTDCTASSSQDAIEVGPRCRVTGCLVSQAGAVGINAGASSFISRNSVQRCTGNSIAVAGGGHVVDNHVDGNSNINSTGNRSAGTGIVGGTSTHILRNQVADTAIAISATNGVVLHNSLDNNATGLSATGVVGPIIDSGNVASSSNPNGNYNF